ncbi:sulfite exporter TauE/SafE family protein [Palleronia sediminis]|uniref:Probable membrane transporter protein n=1 Tax=Palleronia sediminis TaxID=2547833 RepID=A0A4R6AAA3_9RHOB|nr:sulfite exporter TauE/SafE family protein [Palleronia sediminis]TDL79855.1 sulfite exporter TauE/SafE family protein [Palleronia sediminis]
MTASILPLAPELWPFAFAVAMLAGFVKGAVGFALPLVMISGLTVFLEPKLALAGLILPAVLANLAQALRGGWAETRAAIAEFWRLIAAVAVMVFVTAQLVTAMPDRVFFLAVGVPVLAMSAIQLFGVAFVVRGPRAVWDVGLGLISGAIGGVSGVWGPPLVLYLLALKVPRARHMAVQGVVYVSGGVLLLLGHLNSGVLNRETLPLSIALVLPAGLGIALGLRLGDRLNPERLRRMTLVVLVLAGLNLIRRGLTG